MSFIAILVLVTFFLNLFLAIVVIKKRRGKNANFWFGIFTLDVAFWAISIFALFFFQYNFSGNLAFLFASYLPPLFFAFSKNFPRKSNKIISKSVVFSFLLGTFFAIASLTGLIIKKNIFSTGSISVITGFLYLPFLTYFGVHLIYVFFRIWKKYLFSNGQEKTQIKYLFWGTMVFAISASTTNLFLPAFGITFLNSLGPAFSIIMVSAIAYSILKHQLLEIRIVLSRSIIYAMLLTIVSLIFVITTLLSAQYFSNSTVSRWVLTLFVSSLVVFGLEPLKSILSVATDRFFFKASIDYQAVLRKLSESVSYQLDLEPLILELRKTLREELKLKFVATLLRRSTNGETAEFIALQDMLETNAELRLGNASPLISYLRSHRQPAVLDSLERKIDDTAEGERAPLEKSKAEFERMGAALVSPVYAQDHLIAVLVLGPKLSGDTFSGEDLNLIEVLSPQIGSAIQKANLYEEVKQFSEGLKAKVDAATSELRERNTSLQTLQHITKEITRTLDFNQVVQQIADSVSTELGYLGAILVFLDDDMRTVRARAITQTPLTKKALDMLPVKFTDYTTDLQDEMSTSLGHQVLRSGHMMVTAHFAQVISPPLPKLLADGIQKVLGMKTMVVVPINSEGKTIGCIQIGLQQRQEDISKQEFDTMYALADELGVVYRNIKLFDRIQATNQQLEVANAHLQQLDQAKSEFVSIASHQLRTPMTGIMGYLSMMTSGDFGKIAPEHQKILVSLLAESQRMIRLINQFLNVSKIEAGKFTYTKKPTQLLDLAKQEVQELLHVAKDKKLELLTEFTNDHLPETVADPDKIQDVMLNLIDNAIKYTASGSITVGLDMKGPDLHFYVRDTGIGISPNDAKELFNKFVRGSGIAQIHPDGSGLGLFIAKSIIDSHDGKIWVESAGEGTGSTFQFTIPVIHSDPGKDVK
jgi:signal transduction histidine kinase